MFRQLTAVLAIAALGAGCGGGNDDGGRAVSVTLQGSEGSRTTSACGGDDAFELYRRSEEVRYAGNVDPPPQGRFKVKVKAKKCRGTEYVDSREQKVVGRPNGAFGGMFEDLAPGAYFLRARYQGEDKPETEKVYFMVE